jgi:acyl-CoA synthetase (AMP-forming)/AMP-acid ligase II
VNGNLSIKALLDIGKDESPALLAPGLPTLDWAGLRKQFTLLGQALRTAGIGPKDTVAMVLPNGPEMTLAFLTVAGHAVAAPLNPAYRHAEFAFYLDDLNPRAILLPTGYAGPARDAATERDIQIIEVRTLPDAPAGVFELNCGTPAKTTLTSTLSGAESESESGALSEGHSRASEDTALLLHTSGTTSRPKIVPLTEANLCHSALHIAGTLELTAADRCLSIMPQFHIHGLLAATLAPLSAGGSISCPPGFDALQFLRWLESEKPTWYTAVPTMHQTILARARRHPEAARAAGLRFLRSSSASLPPPVFHELEALFDCPVVESYGMTEAAHQMTSNPWQRGRQKPGSVGLAAGPDVAIADNSGRFLGPGEIAEICISGPNVTPGYVANAKSNAESFFVDASGQRWFRTGDQGQFDADGYLFITGRIKELINRGGEKIAPREVDDVLAEFPGIEQVVTFALPHPTLGEDVAVAVVMADGVTLDTDALKDFARERLAPYKVPRKIVVVDAIPKGATGKLQRIGLAEKLGLTA